MATSLYWIAAFVVVFFLFLHKMNFELLQKKDSVTGESMGVPCYKRQAAALGLATAVFTWGVYIKRFRLFDARPGSNDRLIEEY